MWQPYSHQPKGYIKKETIWSSNEFPGPGSQWALRNYLLNAPRKCLHGDFNAAAGPFQIVHRTAPSLAGPWHPPLCTGDQHPGPFPIPIVKRPGSRADQHGSSKLSLTPLKLGRKQEKQTRGK